jgi:hypothetical protein
MEKPVMSKTASTKDTTAPAPVEETIEKRITAALAASNKSYDLGLLITETEAAIAAADATAEAERIKALDPTVSPDPVKAREAMQVAEFSRDRLRTLLPKLQERHQQVAAQENYNRWVVDHDRVKEDVDEAVVELRRLYLLLEHLLPDLLLRIERIDNDVYRVMESKPDPRNCKAADHDGRFLQKVEITARGGMKNYSILKDLRLPEWAPDGGLAWPINRGVDSVFTRPVVFSDPRLYTDRWQEVHEERAAAKAKAEKADAERLANLPLSANPGADWWRNPADIARMRARSV